MTLRSRTRHVRTLLPAAAIFFAATLAPLTASADTDLTIGGTGVVAYANGDNVRIRTAPESDATVAGSVAEGSSVTVVDGTFAAADGSLWYQVEAGSVSGYMVSDYLANSSGILSATSGEAMTVDAVNVRSGPSLADPILGTVTAGTWLSLTGENASGWLSVNYDGYLGYIYGAFLSQDGETAMDGSDAAPVPAPVDEELPVEVPDDSGVTGARYTLDSVNLRDGASLNDGGLAYRCSR
jgi:uncharacterized protein YgiM (DUF1202 family)